MKMGEEEAGMANPTLKEAIRDHGDRLLRLAHPFIKDSGYSDQEIQASFIKVFDSVKNWYIFVETKLKPYEEEIKSGKPRMTYTEVDGSQYAMGYDIFPGIEKKKIPMETYKEINQILLFFLKLHNAYQ